MPDMVTVRIEGLKELEKKMLALGSKIGRKALKGALVAGAAVIRREAQALVPIKSGRLFRAMYIKTMRKPNPFKENVIFGVRHGKKLQRKNLDAFYWKFIEFGHLVRPKKGRRSRSQRISDASSGSGVKFVSAQPFVRPAFEFKKFAALERIKEVLTKKISQLVKEPA